MEYWQILRTDCIVGEGLEMVRLAHLRTWYKRDNASDRRKVIDSRILIEMIELLVEQWYVQREHRKSMNQRFDEMIKKKKHRNCSGKIVDEKI